MSKEFMSTWGWQGSQDPMFGAIKNKDWLKLGGDARVLQTYLENSKAKQGRQFLMQKNVEFGIQAGKVWVVGTIGSQEGPEGTPRKGESLFERHYLLWETSEENRLRVGKFRLNFGLYEPNHTRVIKAPLGFGSNSETYNLEISKITETDETFLTAALGRLDLPRDQSSERALSATYAKYIGTNAKAGISGLFGESLTQRRSFAGLFAIFPPFENGVTKLEVDFQRATIASTPDKSQDLLAGYTSLGYQVAKGILPYFFHEYLHPDLGDRKTKQSSPGVGLQWLPIPHVEIQAEYKRQTLESRPTQPNNVGWLLFHLYL
ncbi:MAG: hypothetical protein HC902_00950 [Calothrix sp. SM1_5_4]|nr:hypothetical protein [Calothrix sp. SM1_5_4]